MVQTRGYRLLVAENNPEATAQRPIQVAIPRLPAAVYPNRSRDWIAGQNTAAQFGEP